MLTPLANYNLLQRKKFQAYIEKHMPSAHYWKWWISNVHLVDIDFVLKWRDKPWSFSLLARNPGITKEDRIKTRHLFDWDFSDIDTMEDYVRLGLTNSHAFSSRDKNILSDFYEFPDFPWSWEGISSNPHISEEFILKHRNKLNAAFLTENPAVTIEFIRKTWDQISWDVFGISENPNISDDNFHYFFDKNSPQNVINNLSERLSFEYILSHPEFSWNIEILCFRDDLTKEIIIAHPDFPWDWEILSCSYNLDKKWMLSQPKVDLEKFYMYNSNLSIDDVEHLLPSQILGNTLQGSLEEKAEFLRRYYAARTISNLFHDVYWFVDYAFCRKRLNKIYDELFGVFET